MDASPKFAEDNPLYFTPKACAASYMTLRLYFFAISSIFSTAFVTLAICTAALNGPYITENEANKAMDENFKKINVVAESYPELKSSENYKTLQQSIADVEEHLQAARRLYNSNVSSFNQLLVTFPTSSIAKSKGMTKKDFFEADEVKKEDVKIDL